MAQKLYITTTNPQLSEDFIKQKLQEIASNLVKLNLLQNTKEYLALNHDFLIPTVKSIDVKEVDAIKTEMIDGVMASISTLTTNLSSENLKLWMDIEQGRLESALSGENWKDEFQGKDVFSIFCGTVLSADRIIVRQAYIDIALSEKPEVFDDIKEIFESFS